MISPVLKLLVNVIINKYLFKSYCVTILTENNTDVFNGNLGVPYMHYCVSCNVGKMRSLILKSLDQGCSDFIVQMESPKYFLEMFEDNIHVTNQRRGDRKIIFLPFEENLNARHDLIDLLKMPAIEFIPDVLMILPVHNGMEEETSNSTMYELATQQYSGERNNNELFILDRWSSGDQSFEKDANLFPDKISNLKGRTVRMATFTYKPYSILELDENDTLVGLDGTEMRTALEFCKWSNCTMEIVRDDEHEWGEIFENRTGNGIIGNVVTDRADIGYGALYSWYHEYGFLDLSMPIVRTGITCIAPAPSLVASWLLPVLPFNTVLWWSVLVSVLYSSAAMYITSTSREKPFSVPQSILDVVGIFVLQAPSVKNPAPAMRTVISLLFLFSLMLTNVYSSGLSSSITVPRYEAPIDTVQQLVDSNIDWGATHDAWIFSILQANEPNMVHLVKKFKKWPFELLKSKGKTRDFAFSVERLPAGHFAIGEYVTEEAVPYLQLMLQDIYWEQCVLMARKSSPFTKRLNRLLGRLHQAGLLHAWETQVVLKHSNYAVQLGVGLSPGRRSGSEGPRSLTTRHLQGPLMLWLLGSVAAILAFVVEVCAGLKKTRKQEI